MPDTLQSRPFRPNPDHCCEKCVFGSGEHSEWCIRVRYDPAAYCEELLALPDEMLLRWVNGTLKI